MDSVEAEYSLTSLGNFHSPDNGFCVLTVKARGHREPVTVVGCAATAAGVDHRDRPRASTSNLRSGMIRGIGRVCAHELEQAFNDKPLDLIETESERLREVPASARSAPGESPTRGPSREPSARSWCSLHQHGASTARGASPRDLRQRRGRGHQREPYRLARAIRGDRVQARRHDRDEAGRREGGDHPGTCRHRLRARRGDEGTLRTARRRAPPAGGRAARRSTNLVRTALDLEQVVCGKGESCVAVEHVLHRDAAPARGSDAERQVEAPHPPSGVVPGLRRELEHLLNETVDAGVTPFIWLRQFARGAIPLTPTGCLTAA